MKARSAVELVEELGVDDGRLRGWYPDLTVSTTPGPRCIQFQATIQPDRAFFEPAPSAITWAVRAIFRFRYECPQMPSTTYIFCRCKKPSLPATLPPKPRAQAQPQL